MTKIEMPPIWKMMIEKPEKTPEEKLFFSKIDIYNDMKEFSDHYIKLSDNRVMLISWGRGGTWEYKVYNLEEP